ncbi:hypothetical protein, partial [Paraburkholderia sp. RL17-347-BIC-D]|uniref:hypothetical protein n=1 Tax=Paraburkholderia sp. RL17-347-BIC-D TaxID=3031632 RepID=UPI0038B714B3
FPTSALNVRCLQEIDRRSHILQIALSLRGHSVSVSPGLFSWFIDGALPALPLFSNWTGAATMRGLISMTEENVPDFK